MSADCIGFDQIPHTSRLFIDFLAGAPSALRFFGAKAPVAAPIAPLPPERHARIADILARQNSDFGASAAALANIERLRNGANCIVTGQQAGLLGGPLLGMFKALTAIKLAAEQNAVPVFWIATTDHDLAEVDHADFLCGNIVHRITATLEAAPGTIAGNARIASDVVGPLRACLRDFTADEEIFDLLARCYAPGERLGAAFGKLWAQLFSEFGLVVIDPNDPGLHALASPVYMQAARQATALNDALRARDRELESAGYHEQVKVTTESTLLFAEVEGARTAVRMVRNLDGTVAFRAGSLDWRSAEEFARWVEANYTLVTPTALLRPVVQDSLLPTIAYVGGPAEIAYFAQSSVLYDALLGGRTPVIARAFATIVEPRIAELMEKHKITIRELLGVHGEEELALELSRRALPSDVRERFASSRKCIYEELDHLAATVGALDATLSGAAATSLRKMRYQLDNLERRAARAHLRREGEIASQARTLWNHLHPAASLQEREIAGAQFLLKYGRGFLRTVESRLNSHCAAHQVIFL